MLTAACFIPISGRIYQLCSTKWGFVLSIVIFEAGSALCGAAPASTAFIIGRAIAGLGSAGIFSGGMMIILPLVPLRRRPVFTSMFGVAFGISSVLGPILGGTLTDHVWVDSVSAKRWSCADSVSTWRWCFYLNLPFGGFTLLAVLLFLHIESPKREKLTAIGQLKRLDPIGIFFFVPSMVSLILALQWGGSTYSWSASKVIGLLVTFSVLFLTFVVVEVLTPETAMAPTRVVLNRSIAGSMAFMFLLSGGLMSVIYYLPTWFQAAKKGLGNARGYQHHPITLILCHHRHPRRHLYGENRLLCSSNAPFPSPLFHRRRLTFNPLTELEPQRLDRLPISVRLRYRLWLPDLDIGRPKRFAARGRPSRYGADVLHAAAWRLRVPGR